MYLVFFSLVQLLFQQGNVMVDELSVNRMAVDETSFDEFPWYPAFMCCILLSCLCCQLIRCGKEAC